MVGIGDIIIVRNIIFHDGVDHAFLFGRPCLVIGFDENNLYYLPITHNVHYTPERSKYIFHAKECRWKRKDYFFHAVTTEQYYQTPLCQHKVCGQISPVVLNEIYQRFLQTQTEENIGELYHLFQYYQECIQEFLDANDDYAIWELYDFLDEFNKYLYEQIFPVNTKSLP